MKLLIVIATIFTFSLTANSEESTSQTQAGWFSPDCSNCSKLLKPGPANLGNTYGVFRPNKKPKKKTSVKIDTAPVGTGQ